MLFSTFWHHSPWYINNWQELINLAQSTASPDLEDILYDRQGAIWAGKCPDAGVSRNGRSHEQEMFGACVQWVQFTVYRVQLQGAGHFFKSKNWN